MAFDRHRLKELRIKNNISISNLSLEANIDRQHLYDLESGERKAPGYEVAERLADFFNVSMDSFSDKTKPFFEKRGTTRRKKKTF